MNIPKEQKQIDPECLALVNAMNKMPGIQTIESCCGHGLNKFRIYFLAENLDVLPPLLYWFMSCHSGCYGWRIYANTDCAMSPVKFGAESSHKGEQVYKEAQIIAECIEKWLKE